MITGGNTANRTNRARVNAAIDDDGGCSHCRPHRGENEGRGGRRRHVRWVNGKAIPRKSKAQK